MKGEGCEVGVEGDEGRRRKTGGWLIRTRECEEIFISRSPIQGRFDGKSAALEDTFASLSTGVGV